MRLRAANAVGMHDGALINQGVLQRPQEEIFHGHMAVANDQDDQSRESGVSQASIPFPRQTAIVITLSQQAVKKRLDVRLLARAAE